MRIIENEKTHPSVITIFGGSGDLTWRKLIPALYNLYLDGWLNKNFKIICIGNSEFTHKDFGAKLRKGVEKFSRRGKPATKNWSLFSEGIHYESGDFTKDQIYTFLKKEIAAFENTVEAPINKIFYLAVPPHFFEVIGEKLGKHGLSSDKEYSRLVIEKPFGTDLESAKKLNASLLANFDEQQLYRIDHYLGKETVQNILAFRFANAMFEPLWNRNYISHIQISVAEDLGVEDRGRYYEGSGALRDMIQNHLMQLLCLIAMEPPVSFNADEVRNKKVDVLHAIRKPKPEDVKEMSVRGQYGDGWINGKKVPAYRKEQNVNPETITETFAALKLYIDNWRWSGIPFYLRSGKRMQQKSSTIMIQFKHVPHESFPESSLENWNPNRLIMCLQPEMGIRLRFQGKRPGLDMHLAPVEMKFDYEDAYSATGTPEGYETLLQDVIQGDATLFMRRDQVEAAWEIVMPVLNAWQHGQTVTFPNYAAGSYGPEAAETLIAKETGFTWFTVPLKTEEE